MSVEKQPDVQSSKAAAQPSTELSRPARRHFSNAYKRRIVAEADGCTERGGVGALLRREGLYSSHLTDWRRQAAKGELDDDSAPKRGRPAQPPHVDEVVALRRENAKLAQQLEQARYIIDAQKKLSLALEQTLHQNADNA